MTEKSKTTTKIILMIFITEKKYNNGLPYDKIFSDSSLFQSLSPKSAYKYPVLGGKKHRQKKQWGLDKDDAPGGWTVDKVTDICPKKTGENRASRRDEQHMIKPIT